MTAKNQLASLYDLVTGDEDARICKDIPSEACSDQPRNFFAYLGANLLTKVADELSSAKLILPWLMSALGAPAALTGFLVPIREAGVLLPQLVVAAYIRRLPLRKWVWIIGALFSAGVLLLMGVVSGTLSGASAGWTLLVLLAGFSLARGLCSVSAKDVLGKTVSKARRGRLMGLSAAIAGGMTLALGLYLQFMAEHVNAVGVIAALLIAGGLIFALSAFLFAGIREQPGATEGGGNALAAALQGLDLLRTDGPFRRFVTTRVLLLSVALAPPFYVLLAQVGTDGDTGGLGLMVIASGLGGSLSAPAWGRLSDRSSRVVMTLAAGAAGLLGITTWALARAGTGLMEQGLVYALLFLLLNVAHSGVRLGRKVYLVDMATAENRATLVAVSNTVIGVAMLLGGVIGILGDAFDAATVILVLGMVSLVAAARAWRLAEVSEPE
jgi:MFS family permease